MCVRVSIPLNILTKLGNDFTTEISIFHPLSISGPAVASFLLAIAQCDQLLCDVVANANSIPSLCISMVVNHPGPKTRQIQSHSQVLSSEQQ